MESCRFLVHVVSLFIQIATLMVTCVLIFLFFIYIYRAANLLSPKNMKKLLRTKSLFDVLKITNIIYVFNLLSTNVFCEKCFMENVLVKEKNILSSHIISSKQKSNKTYIHLMLQHLHH